ncbi:SdpI family protein [Staphylococcus americanisciuri]|uniref:SdpI family protein n=1 Tax=Staphylococcus americanisciuri TaxID=2973940 RepID=A0ABT2F0E2_9STAP|nr:SdpI family protein [Staphylococcus americanisciuri]MCS4485920.1 SdpI family protein [Staphylococcus americanisciuri]
MTLLLCSLICYLLGRLFSKAPPQQINYFWGFRTNKSMKNQQNWEHAQALFGEIFEKIFRYAIMASIVWFIVDVVLLIVGYENILLVSDISQAIILFILMFIVYQRVNRELD